MGYVTVICSDICVVFNLLQHDIQVKTLGPYEITTENLYLWETSEVLFTNWKFSIYMGEFLVQLQRLVNGLMLLNSLSVIWKMADKSFQVKQDSV